MQVCLTLGTPDAMFSRRLTGDRVLELGSAATRGGTDTWERLCYRDEGWCSVTLRMELELSARHHLILSSSHFPLVLAKRQWAVWSDR
jgi:hypothetical protein